MKCVWGVLAVVSAVVCVVAGCGPKAPKLVEMSNPPAFGSTSALSTLDGFIVGKWGLKEILDPNVAKQLGMESIAREQQDSDVTDIITFKAGGTFVYRMVGFAHKLEGKWAVAQGVLNLSFDTVDGLPLGTEMARVKADEEHGGQGEIATAFVYEHAQHEMDLVKSWTVGPDKKCLKVPAAGDSPLGGMDNPLTLVRMALDASDKS